MAVKIPVAPTKPRPAPVPKKSDTGRGPSSVKPAATNKPAAKAKAKDSASAAEKRAVKRENDAKKKAGQRYLAQASNLEVQAKAIKDALNTEFARARDQNLGDIDKLLGEQFTMLTENHGLRTRGFLQAAKDNEIAASSNAEGGIRNLVRERQDALTGILEQGAGETDAMRAMVMSARNWHSNQTDTNRSFFDTATSINTGITDLNLDTKTALANANTSAEEGKERVWQDFYNSRGEAFTQLGNVRGQQSDYYAQAKELGVSAGKTAKGNDRTKVRKKEMEKAFADAANERGKSYVNPGLQQWVKDFKGADQVEASQSNTNLAAAMTIEPMAKAEGATLRRWEAA
jgi:hypothetical protein